MMNTVQYMPSFDSGADALSMAQALQSKIVLGPARASQVPAQLGPTNTPGLVNRPLYLHQPQTVQPATSTTTRLAVGTQFINAYNADGQPVTIAINPNGTHQVLTGVSAAPAGNSLTLGTTNGISLQAQTATVQVQPMRPMQAGTTATLINTPQGQRLVQLSNADPQAAGAAPQGITYKLVQQAMPAPNGPRYLVQQAAPNAGPTMVQRMVQQPTSTAPVAMKGPTLQHVALRPAAPAATNTNLVGPTAQQLGGMQVGRSLIQVASRPNTVTTYNPTTGLRTNNNATQLADMQQGSAASLQLPSTMLVRPGGGVEGTVAAGVTAQQLQAMTAQLQQNAGGVGVAAGAQQGGVQVSLQPAQSLQQQVKDTVAQQRQQQLLASLRARVASLNPAQPGSNSASGTSPTMAAQVNSSFPQVMLKQSALGAAQQQQQQLLGLRTGNDGNTNSAQAGLLQSLLNSQAVRQQQQQQRMLEESQQLNLLSLTRAQQQALLGGADLGGFRSEIGDVGQANGAHGVFHLPGQVSLSEELLSQNLALKQQFRLSDGMDAGKANGAALSMAASSLSASAGARSNGVSSPSPLLGMNPTADGLHLDNGGGGTHVNMLGNNALLPPGLGAIDLHGASKHELNANNLQQQAGKDDLKSILMSIGLELARHGIPVSTAVEAGWLGVLSQGDVAVLQATYAQEERRLANINNAAASLAQQQHLQQQAAAAVQLPPLPDVPPGLMGWPHLSALNRFAEPSHAAAGAGLAANHGLGGASSRPSNGSPAASVHSAYGSAGSHRDPSFGPAGLGMPGPAAAEPAAAAAGPTGTLQEIDDARFSAFAYDFFGGMEAGEGTLGGSVGGELLEPLEPASQRSSSAEVAPLRAPSWPADGPSVHTLKTGTQSVASFSELGHSTSAEHPSSATKDNCDAASTASSSNHELVARIANLDLGCGFY